MTPEDLRERGWRPIVSDAQAAQLLRRELKHHRNWQQRVRNWTGDRETPRWDYRHLLAIQRGNWFRFLKNPTNSFCSILIWRRKPT